MKSAGIRLRRDDLFSKHPLRHWVDPQQWSCLKRFTKTRQVCFRISESRPIEILNCFLVCGNYRWIAAAHSELDAPTLSLACVDIDVGQRPLIRRQWLHADAWKGMHVFIRADMALWYIISENRTGPFLLESDGHCLG